MNGVAVAAIIAVVIVAVGGGAAYAMGVFDKDGGSEGDDDWTAHVGDQVTYEASGTQTYWERGFISYHKVTIDFTGTNTNTLLYYDENTGWWFINYASVRDYSYRGVPVRHDDNNSNQWGMSEDFTATVKGTTDLDTKYYGTKTCEIVELKNEYTGYTEIQYSDDDNVYRAEITKTAGFGYDEVVITTILDLKSTTKTDVDIELGVDIYSDDGLEVKGSGTYLIGQTVTVTAEGKDFYGWYDFNVSADNPISKERSYSFDIVKNTVLYALTGETDKSYESGHPVTLQSGKDLVEAEWTIIQYDRTIKEIVGTASASGASPTYTFDTPGDYRLIIDGTTASGQTYKGYRVLFVNGDLTNTYEFKVRDSIETMSLSIKFSDYVDYMDKTNPAERRDYNNKDLREKHDSQFVEADTTYVRQIANNFLEIQKKYSLTNVEMAAAVLSFTQYIPYADDINTHGVIEYWNYPVETLYLKKGDCEDGSILCSAIFKALGFKSCLILMSKHMAVGFLGTDMKGFDDWTSPDDPFTPHGYYYGETTSTSYKLGEIPKDSKGRISVTFVAEIQIGTGYDEENRSTKGPPGPRNPFRPFPYRAYMSSRDTRRTFGSFDAMSLRSTENPAAENIT